MNKKAGSRILSIWMFIIWILIGVGIVGGVLIFYSASADVRKVEAEILVTNLADCLIEEGYLVEGFDENFDVFSKCKLDEQILDKTSLYYFKIEVYDEQGELKFQPIEKGNDFFLDKCRLKEEAEAPQWAECYEKNFYVLKKEGELAESVILDIFAGSNNQGRKL